MVKEAGSEEQEARSGKREARSGKREARKNGERRRRESGIVSFFSVIRAALFGFQRALHIFDPAESYSIVIRPFKTATRNGNRSGNRNGNKNGKMQACKKRKSVTAWGKNGGGNLKACTKKPLTGCDADCPMPKCRRMYS